MSTRKDLINCKVSYCTEEEYNMENAIHQSDLSKIAKHEYHLLDPLIKEENQEILDDRLAIKKGNLFEEIVRNGEVPSWVSSQTQPEPTATMKILCDQIIERGIKPEKNNEAIFDLMNTPQSDGKILWSNIKDEKKRKAIASFDATPEVLLYLQERVKLQKIIKKGGMILPKQEIELINEKAHLTKEWLAYWYQGFDLFWQVPFKIEINLSEIVPDKKLLQDLGDKYKIDINQIITIVGKYDIVAQDTKSKLIEIIDLKYTEYAKYYFNEYSRHSYIQSAIYSWASKAERFSFVTANNNCEPIRWVIPKPLNDKRWIKSYRQSDFNSKDSIVELIFKYLWIKENEKYSLDPDILINNNMKIINIEL